MQASALKLLTTLAAAICLPVISPVFAQQDPASSDSGSAELQTGAEIWAARCADCHGARGEGVPEVCPQPIFGDRSDYDLTSVIEQSMPEGEPESCVGEEAAAVARWMQQAFYSPEAQARINPPQLSLSRLTVSQHRNAVADLFESFAWRAEPNDEPGLKAVYYDSRNFNGKKKVIERTDPSVAFDFGNGTPDPEKIAKPEDFSAHWDGGLVITESGRYEFVVRTENACRLYINNSDEPVIDAWVKSGDETEYRGSLFLLEGRVYRLRLEWFRAKEPTASVALLWKPPHQQLHTIPSDHLRTQSGPRIIIADTEFPPDDRSDGYERGTSVSPEWHSAVTEAATNVTAQVLSDLNRVLNIRKNDDRNAKIREFCDVFVQRAFRRPLTDEQKSVYVSRHFEECEKAEDALRRVLLLTLTSPRFLYRDVDSEHPLFERAERLSFALVDSVPDVQLLEAASKGWISSEQGLRDQAVRLAKSFRGRVRLQGFLRTWLNLERLHDLGRDETQFPGFTDALASDLRVSFERTLAEFVRSDQPDLRTLLTNDEVWMNRRMAEFYGVPDSDQFGDDFRPVVFEPEHRGGVMTHPLLLAGLSYRDVGSPIHRGVFAYRSVLGRGLKAPPDAVTPTPPDLHPDLTTRERTTLQTSPAMCSNCHQMINGLGFGLEHFDAAGRYRETEKSRPIDASGIYRPRHGDAEEFRGADQLAALIASSDDTAASVSRQMFHDLVRQPVLAYGPDAIRHLSAKLAENQYDVRQLMIEAALMAATFEENRTSAVADSR